MATPLPQGMTLAFAHGLHAVIAAVLPTNRCHETIDPNPLQQPGCCLKNGILLFISQQEAPSVATYIGCPLEWQCR
jgi:hypothetical protein